MPSPCSSFCAGRRHASSHFAISRRAKRADGAQCRARNAGAQRTEELEAANQRLRDEAASRAAAEAQIRQMQKMEAVGLLTGGIAHDFNNMLAIVVGSLDIAKRHLDDREKAERFICQCHGGRAAGRAAHRPPARLFTPTAARCAAAWTPTSWCATCRICSRRSIGENIRLETRAGAAGSGAPSPTPPSSRARSSICASTAATPCPTAAQLDAETANATLDEAYAATNCDARPGDYVVISVADTGTGMTPEVMARAFDPFFTTKEHGQRHRAWVCPRSTASSVSPRDISTSSRASARARRFGSICRDTEGALQPRPRPRTNAPQSPSNREMVLVVEDEADVRSMTVEALTQPRLYGDRRRRPRARARARGRSARSAQLLFTDVVMPGMNGHALAERIKERQPGIKVLFTTGYTRGISARGRDPRSRVRRHSPSPSPSISWPPRSAAFGPAGCPRPDRAEHRIAH